MHLKLPLLILSALTLLSGIPLVGEGEVFFDAPKPKALKQAMRQKQKPKAVPKAPPIEAPIAAKTAETKHTEATPEEAPAKPQEVALEVPSEETPTLQAQEPADSPESTTHSTRKQEMDEEIAAELENLKIEPVRKHGEILLNRARLATKYEHTNYRKAEKLYLEALKYELTKDQRKDLLLELALIYERVRVHSKVAMIYERFLNEYQEDPSTPQILIRLGRIYRDMGAYKMANERFYDVLDMSLKIHQNQLPLYRHLSMKAQLEIADTFFIMGEYDKVIKLFNRMKNLPLEEDEQERMDFKRSYALYHLKRYPEAVESLKNYILLYPDSPMNPEAHYILANTYEQMNLHGDAIAEVIELLSTNEPQDDTQKTNWIFWKRKTANELANNYYEDGDFISALQIYQAMARLSDEPSWQWPVIYQIGRCFERLQKFNKAKESYKVLVSADEWKDKKFEMTESLASIQNTAKWRLKHLEWLDTAEVKLGKLLDPKLQANGLIK